MAVPVIQSFTFNTAGSAVTSITLTKPSGVVAGDLLVLLVGNEDNTATASFAAITGWTKEYEFGDATPDTKIGMYWRIADGTEGNSETVSWADTNTDFGGGWYLRITGADITSASPIHIVGTSTQSSGATSQAAPSITTAINDCLVIAHHSFDGGDGTRGVTGIGWPSSFPANQVLYDTTATGAWSGGWVSKDVATAGATGDVTFTSTNSDGMVQVQFAIAPTSSGIISVTPDDFGYAEQSIDIGGVGFETVQGDGAIYISNASALGGGTQVNVSNAVTSWSDIAINLDLTTLSAPTILSLETLGPGIRYIIVVTSASNEYPYIVTTHRIKAFELGASARIEANGADTTAQLTAPSGKTTADFGGGRIQDDENPTDSVTLNADEYREDEWSIYATDGADYDQTYVFRVLVNGTVAATNLVTPRVTVKLLQDGLASVDPQMFDYDATSVDINGLGFGDVQGTSSVYISDASTLAGSTNEVEITAGINSWSDTLINLNLDQVSEATAEALGVLGPGTRYIIVFTDTFESSVVVITYRAKVFFLADSSNISAGGVDATTPQLIAPLGKTTADFWGGIISDDTNPTESGQVGQDEYREDEWSIVASSRAVYGSKYEFRVLEDGEPLPAYSIIPELTIVEAAPTGLNMKINIGDAWKEVAAAKINIGGTWKDISAIKQNIGDTWKDV